MDQVSDQSQSFNLENLNYTQVVEMLRPFKTTVESDLSILLPGKEPLKVHKHVLAQKSSYFAEKISKDSLEANQQLQFPEISPDILKTIVEWMYSDSIVLTRDDTIDIYSAAKFFAISELQVLCERYISSDVDCAYRFLIRCFENDSNFTKENGVRLASVLFIDLVAHRDFPALAKDPLIALLARDELNVNSENEVFAAGLHWLLSDWVSRNEICSDVLRNVRFHLLQGGSFEEVLQKCHPFVSKAGDFDAHNGIAKIIYKKMQEDEKKSQRSHKGPRQRGSFVKERPKTYEVDYTASPAITGMIIQSRDEEKSQFKATVEVRNRSSVLDVFGSGSVGAGSNSFETVHLWLQRLEVPADMVDLVKTQAFVGVAHSCIAQEVSAARESSSRIATVTCRTMPLPEPESESRDSAVDVVADSAVTVDAVVDAESKADGTFDLPGFRKLPRFAKVAAVSPTSRPTTANAGSRRQGDFAHGDKAETRDQSQQTDSGQVSFGTYASSVGGEKEKDAETQRVTCTDCKRSDFDTDTQSPDLSSGACGEVQPCDLKSSLGSIADSEMLRFSGKIDNCGGSELSAFTGDTYVRGGQGTVTVEKPLLLPERDRCCNGIVNVSAIVYDNCANQHVKTEICFASNGRVTTTSKNADDVVIGSRETTLNTVLTERGMRDVNADCIVLLAVDIKCPNVIGGDDQFLSLEVRADRSLFQINSDNVAGGSGVKVSVKSCGDRRKIVHIGSVVANRDGPKVPLTGEPQRDKVINWLNSNPVDGEERKANEEEGKTVTRRYGTSVRSKIPRPVALANVKPGDSDPRKGPRTYVVTCERSKLQTRNAKRETRNPFTPYSVNKHERFSMGMKCVHPAPRINPTMADSKKPVKNERWRF